MTQTGSLITNNAYGRLRWSSKSYTWSEPTMIVNGEGYLMIKESQITPPVVWTSPH